MSEEKKTVEIKGLGTAELVREPVKEVVGADGEVEVQAKPGVYRLPEQDLMKFYENHGIPNAKTVMKTINTARKELGKVAAQFLQDQVIETKSSWELRMGMGENGVDTKLESERESKNVRTGEKYTQYGRFTMKLHAPNPLDAKACEEMSSAIEKAIRSSAGL